jgi:hypothetical protein
LLGTFVQGGTATGTSGTPTIVVSTATGINVGANIALLGVFADTDIIHPTDIALTASTPSSFGFTTSVTNTIEGSLVYLLIDSEIILGTVSGGTFTVSQRGALGTTAATHLINANATLMRSYVDRVTAVVGTTVTLSSNLPRSFTSANFRCGSLDTSLTGVLTIDGEYDRTTSPGLFCCLASALSTNFYVAGNIKLKRARHGGLILYGARNANVMIDSVSSCGKPASSLGSSIWLFANTYRCSVKVRLLTDGNLGVAIDNKSSGVSFYGADGSCLENVVEIDDVSDHVAECQISGSRDNVVKLNFTNCTTTGVIVDTGVPQTVTAPTTTNNVVIIGSQKTALSPSVVAQNTVIIQSKRLTGTINLAAPLACAANATTNSATATLTGLVSGQVGRVIKYPGALPTGLEVRPYASALNTYRLEFVNANGGAQNAPAGDYVVRFEGDF